MISTAAHREVVWVGSSLRDLRRFPRDVMRAAGRDLYVAQCGKTPPGAKPLKGFGGAAVQELRIAYDGNAYRAIYTVQFGGRLYVLHCFQKKSTKGIATPKKEMDVIKSRLKDTEILHREWLKEKADDKNSSGP